MATLNREGLIAALAIRTKDVTLPGGGAVAVRTLSAAQRIAMSSDAVGEDGKIDTARYSALIVAATVVDDAGVCIFSPADADMLLAGASDVFEALFGAAQEINGIGTKAVEQARGN